MSPLLLLLVACSPEPSAPTPAVRVPARVEVEAGSECTPTGRGLVEQVVEVPVGARAGLGVAVADFDDDGLLDVFVPNHHSNQLLMGSPWGLLKAPERLTSTQFRSESVSSVDYDSDGDVDIFLGTVSGSYLLINDGTGSFLDWKEVSDKASWTVGGTWGDINGDGGLDLLICNHALNPPTQDQLNSNSLPGGDGSELLLSDKKGGFVDVSDRIAAVDDLYPNTCLLQDLDNDQDLDLYMVNDYGPWSGPNRVLWNDGKGFFTEDEGNSGLEVTVMGMGVAVASLDASPVPSLLLSSWGEMKYIEAMEGGWVDSTAARGFALGEQQQVAWGVAMPDMDNDGDVDAAVTFGALFDVETEDYGLPNPDEQPDALFHQEDGHFAQSAEVVLDDPSSGRGLVAADLDRNGSMDLIVHSLDDGTHIYFNDCPDQHWVTIRLEQQRGNRQAIGARVELEAGGKTQVQWVHAGGTSMASSAPSELHFGLGGAEKIDRIRVIWPNGDQSEVEAQPVDVLLRLSRD
ncbi:MAG TPA: CRTAC1 family protein [Myxococcota bacterium]|nr:CRTAC1 family protein [Myxococcota bacterium]